MLTVEDRIVSKKRHTIGYVINGVEVSMQEAVKLASRGWLSNATVEKGRPYIVGDQYSLYKLPTIVK